MVTLHRGGEGLPGDSHKPLTSYQKGTLCVLLTRSRWHETAISAVCSRPPARLGEAAVRSPRHEAVDEVGHCLQSPPGWQQPERGEPRGEVLRQDPEAERVQHARGDQPPPARGLTWSRGSRAAQISPTSTASRRCIAMPIATSPGTKPGGSTAAGPSRRLPGIRVTIQTSLPRSAATIITMRMNTPSAVSEAATPAQ